MTISALRICLPLALMLSGFASPATANEDAATDAVNPACAEAPFRDFDFWIGTWDVTTPNGQVAGTNTITMEEGGCLLVERWTGASGGTGQSYNFVDRGTGKWRQVWVSSGFTIDYSGGLDADGVMALEGRIAYAANPENNAPFRGRWTLREDGTVEQVFHQYSTTEDMWKPWFTGIYTRTDRATDAEY